MGWNPYNHFSGNYNETTVRAHAALLVALGLKDLGYEYVNLDAKWGTSSRGSDGRLVPNFNLRDDGGHTPLWLCAAWGWEKCVRLLLTLPHVHPLVPDAQGVSPEEAARRVGFHQVRRPASAEPSSIEGAVVTHPRTQIADAIKVRAEELGVALPERAFWDEPDKRFYVKEPEAAPAAEESDDEEDME